MLTQLLNESAPSGAQAQGAVAFSRLGDGKPHNKTAAGTAGAPLEVLFCPTGTGQKGNGPAVQRCSGHLERLRRCGIPRGRAHAGTDKAFGLWQRVRRLCAE